MRESTISRDRLTQKSLPARAERLVHVLVALGPFALWAVTRNLAPWGDEEHFLQTVRLFGQGLTLDLLKGYPEMSAPLTYITYAGWGHVVGFGTPELRLLAPILASATASIWFSVLVCELRSPLLLLLAFATIVLNPYFVGLSVFVFTDMLALLGLSICSLGVSRRTPWLIAVGLATATCARQYLAFLAVALVATALLSRDERDKLWRLALPAVFGMIPLGLFFLLWDGQLAPANRIRSTYLSEGFRFDPHALSLYLAAPAVYLAPVVLLTVRRLSGGTLMGAAAFGAFALIFPIQPAIAQVREGRFTVGFLHRAADLVLPDPALALFFVLLTIVNGAALIRGGADAARRWRARTLYEPELFMWMGFSAFLVVMPFSYMPWEKYALPQFMLQGAALGMFLDGRKPDDGF